MKAYLKVANPDRNMVYICSCGTNISDNLDFDELVSFTSSLEDVAYAKIHSLFCTEDGKNFLADDIIKESPDRVVIAACSPKKHEKTFRDVLQKAGVNPYLFQMVNIREQVAWVTDDKAAATEKAKAYIRAAVRRVNLNEPLEKKEIACNTDAVVVAPARQGWSPPSCSQRQAERFILSKRTPLSAADLQDMKTSFPRWSAHHACWNP